MFTTVTSPTEMNVVSTTTKVENSSNDTNCFGPKDHDVPRSVDIYLNVVACIILILSVLANTLVLRGIYLTRCKPLSYILIANIAVAELLGAFLTPFGLHYLTKPWSWVFGKVMCILIPPADVCCSIVVSFTLAAFSVYGCMVLRKPQKRMLKITVYVSVVMSWLWGLTLTVPMTIFSELKSYPLCNGGEVASCVLPGDSKDLVKWTYVNVAPFVCRLMIPFAVTIMAYGTLLFKIKKLIGRTRDCSQRQEMSAHVTSISNNEEQSVQQDNTDEHQEEAPATANNEPRSRINELENKLRRIIYWMVIIYLICYAPEHFTFLSWRFDWVVIDHMMVFRKHTFVVMTVPKLLHPICFGWAAGIIQRNFNCFL